MKKLLHPWWQARRRWIGRLAVQSILLAALLSAVGLHGARACTAPAGAFAAAQIASDPCHRRAPALDACAVNFDSDGQAARLASVDLPALAPLPAARIEPVASIAAGELRAANGAARQRAGPPLYLLLQRFLR